MLIPRSSYSVKGNTVAIFLDVDDTTKQLRGIMQRGTMRGMKRSVTTCESETLEVGGWLIESRYFRSSELAGSCVIGMEWKTYCRWRARVIATLSRFGRSKNRKDAECESASMASDNNMTSRSSP